MNFDPIHPAAGTGNIANLQSLLASGTEVDERDSAGCTALYFMYNAEVAKVLIEAGAKVDVRDEHGQTLLHHQAFIGKANVVEFLLRTGANPKAKDKGGDTPFDAAQIRGKLKGTDAYWKLNEAKYD